MTENNIVTSSSIKPETTEKNPVKKAPAKKAAAKKADAPKKEVGSGKVVVIFESGSSYSSNGLRFTREDNIQEVTQEEADFLLTLDNFRTPDALELEEYLASKED
jgi:hypothetical protein